MEVGVEVWVKDTKGDQSWISAVVQAKVRENVSNLSSAKHLNELTSYCLVIQEYAEDGKLTLVAQDEYGSEIQFV